MPLSAASCILQPPKAANRWWRFASRTDALLTTWRTAHVRTRGGVFCATLHYFLVLNIWYRLSLSTHIFIRGCKSPGNCLSQGSNISLFLLRLCKVFLSQAAFSAPGLLELSRKWSHLQRHGLSWNTLLSSRNETNDNKTKFVARIGFLGFSYCLLQTGTQLLNYIFSDIKPYSLIAFANTDYNGRSSVVDYSCLGIDRHWQPWRIAVSNKVNKNEKREVPDVKTWPCFNDNNRRGFFD